MSKKKKRDDICDEETPGPADYKLPSVLGCKEHDVRYWKNPCYSFGTRAQGMRPKPLPGPADYTLYNVTRNGKDTSPQTVLNSRLPFKGLFQGPGPGAYTPNMNAILHSAPAYQFGRKLKYDPRFVTPAPNVYTVKDLGKSSPAFSIKGRRPSKKTSDTPGPAAYDPPKLDRGPAFTLNSRKKDRSRTDMPGPGAYDPQMKYVLPRPAGFTLNGRPNPCIKPLITPADNAF